MSDLFTPDRRVLLTAAEYDQVMDARYLQRWANHINFHRQVGLGVILTHPRRELKAIKQDARQRRLQDAL